MTSREVIRRLVALGAQKLRQKGSHKGEDIGIGLLRAIQKDMAACYSDGWLLG